MDEGSGTNLADSSGAGNAGTLYNTPTWADRKGTGDCLTFNGSDEYAAILGLTSDNAFADKTFSVCFWLKRADMAAALEYFVCKDGAGGWRIGLNSGSIVVILKQGGSDAYSSAGTKTTNDDGSWHHAVCIITTNTTSSAANSTSFYIDKVNDAVLSETKSLAYAADNTDYIRIARRSAGSYFTGSLDDVRIYDHGLTQSEVTAIYDATV